MPDDIIIRIGDAEEVPIEIGEKTYIKGDPGATFIPTVADNGEISWTNDSGLPNPPTVNIMGPQGEPGNNGADGVDGVSPGVTVSSITGGHAVTITDAEHPGGQTFNVMDGQDGNYYKPDTGIPYADLSSGVQTSLGKADSAYQKPSGGIPATDLADGVIPTVPSAYTSDPAMDGTASPGSSTAWARGDHVHPSDTTRVAKSGDTMTGYLEMKTSNTPVDGEPYSGGSEIIFDRINLLDKNGTIIGRLNERISSGGKQGTYLMAYRLGVQNYLGLCHESNGDMSIHIPTNGKAPWRSALGLGTSGEFPITLAQGGTGATTAEAARISLGLPISATTYSIAAGATVNVSMENGECALIVVAGGTAGVRGAAVVYCNASSNIYSSVIGDSLSSVTLTNGSGTGILGITNNYSYQVKVLKIAWK